MTGGREADRHRQGRRESQTDHGSLSTHLMSGTSEDHSTFTAEKPKFRKMPEMV
jgi:hypothetical protein